jgi:glutathione S-transferase
MSARPTVYFHRVCPFAQRAMIMVHEAMNATADPAVVNVKEVSLNNMPSWYASGVNPRETLPGIKFPDGTSYPESMLIAKYIDTAFLAPRGRNLMPVSPAGVAFTVPEMEAKIGAFMNAVWAMYSCLGAQEADIPAKVEAVRVALKEAIEKTFTASSGPFVYGDHFSMADVAIIPFVLRFNSTLKAYSNLRIAEEFPRLRLFIDACLRRPSVASSSCAGEFYVAMYGAAGYTSVKPNWEYELTVAEGDPFSERIQIIAAKLLAAIAAKNKVAPAAVADVANEADDTGCHDELLCDYSFVKIKTVVVPQGLDHVPRLVTPHDRVIVGTAGITEYLLSNFGSLLAGGNNSDEQFAAVSLRPHMPTPAFVSGFTTVSPAQAALSAAATIRGAFFADHNDGLVEGVGSDAIMSGDKSKLESKDGLSDVAKWNLNQMERTLANNAQTSAEGPFVLGKHISEFDLAMVPVLNRVALLYGADAFAAAAPKVAALLAAAKEDAVVAQFLKR